MPVPGNLLTTAMAVMPHVSYYEDMYVQASEHFPGIVLDLEQRKLRFSMEKFIMELEECLSRFDEPEYFDISDTSIR